MILDLRGGRVYRPNAINAWVMALGSVPHFGEMKVKVNNSFVPRLQSLTATGALGRALPSELPERTKNDIETAEALLAQDFKVVTTNGTPVPGLFSIAETGFYTNYDSSRRILL